jgi:hypothetical protein
MEMKDRVPSECAICFWDATVAVLSLIFYKLLVSLSPVCPARDRRAQHVRRGTPARHGRKRGLRGNFGGVRLGGVDGCVPFSQPLSHRAREQKGCSDQAGVTAAGHARGVYDRSGDVSPKALQTSAVCWF